MASSSRSHEQTRAPSWQEPEDIAMLLDEGSGGESSSASSSPRPHLPALRLALDIDGDSDPGEIEDGFNDLNDIEDGFEDLNDPQIEAARDAAGAGSLAPAPRSVTFDLPSEEDDDLQDVMNAPVKASTLPDDIKPTDLQASSLKCAERPVEQTPVHKASTTMDIPHGRSSPAPSRGSDLVAELGPVFIGPKILYQRLFFLPTDDQLAPFVAADCGGVYTNRRWHVPKKPGFERNLYTPMVEILNTILDKLVTPYCPDGVERRFVEAHTFRFKHKGEDNYTSPDIIVRACGPSFAKPPDGSGLGYSNIATIIEMKRECDMGGSGAHIEQMSIGARQVLAHQPNRFFIRCFLLSEETCRLFHFDRSGAEILPAMTIHATAEKEKFIRMIVTLCSVDEKILGFDTSIQWDTSDGIKKNGRLFTNKKEYHLVHQDPIAVQVIRGRATTCWAVEDPKSKRRFVVKDSWTPQGRTQEHVLLEKAVGLTGVCQLVSFDSGREKAVGLTGVCQLVSFDSGREETKNYRSFFTNKDRSFCNRIASRVVIEEYGTRIQHFESKLQAAAAIRDAIAGHARLLGRAEILHRDINNKNILLGKVDAVGHRGVLIDLNVAIDLENDHQGAAKEARTGSRFFQSITILDYIHDLTAGSPPAHDDLDDLESFFYVLCFLFLIFLPNNQLRPSTDPGRKVIRGWASEDAERAANSKSALFDIRRPHGKIAIDAVRTSWGDPCANLFERYLTWVGEIREERGRLIRQLPAKTPVPQGIFKPILENVVIHYATVLGFFEDAIAALGGAADQAWTVATDAFPQTSVSVPNEKKRARSPSGDSEGDSKMNPSPPKAAPAQPRRKSSRLRTFKKPKVSG